MWATIPFIASIVGCIAFGIMSARDEDDEVGAVICGAFVCLLAWGGGYLVIMPPLYLAI